MKILVTNDDSHRSPLLGLLIELIAPLGEVRLVLPQHERSWSGKSMTRFGSVFARRGDVCGYPAWLVSGTPADCVNLGVYSLWEEKPDLVISGINAGLNAGLGFLWSSGTVGAAIEANLAGVAALAVSQALDSATMSRYAGSYELDASTCTRFSDQYRRFLPGVLKKLCASLGNPAVRDGVVWNMNFPSVVADNAEIRTSAIGSTSYARAFVEDLSEKTETSRAFHHRAELIRHDDGANTDIGVLENGHVSLTPILLRGIDGGRPGEPQACCQSLLNPDG